MKFCSTATSWVFWYVNASMVHDQCFGSSKNVYFKVYSKSDLHCPTFQHRRSSSVSKAGSLCPLLQVAIVFNSTSTALQRGFFWLGDCCLVLCRVLSSFLTCPRHCFYKVPPLPKSFGVQCCWILLNTRLVVCLFCFLFLFWFVFIFRVF